MNTAAQKMMVLVGLMASGNALAFTSGDRIVCFDDVSNETYNLKVVDIGDQEAFVRITGRGSRFYPGASVAFSQNNESAVFSLLQNGIEVEAIEVEHSVKTSGRGVGLYSDRGDSRSIACEMR